MKYRNTEEILADAKDDGATVEHHAICDAIAERAQHLDRETLLQFLRATDEQYKAAVEKHNSRKVGPNDVTRLEFLQSMTAEMATLAKMQSLYVNEGKPSTT